MGQIVLPGDPPVEIMLRRSRRARRLSLRISGLDGRVTLSMPLRVPEREAQAFVRDKEPWIRRHLAGQVAPETPVPGGTLAFEGRLLPIRLAPVRAVTATPEALCVPERRAERTPALLGAFLKARARDRLAAASDRHSAALGRSYTALSLRDTRSRWGSCSAEGRLMYSWRLVMAPPEVLDYVAAHEVAHLAEMNHSPAYWAVVARLMPGYAAPRQWLRQNGAALHRPRFGD